MIQRKNQFYQNKKYIFVFQPYSTAISMINFFKSAKINSLQKKYDKLIKEAYSLSKTNPAEGQKILVEAQEIQKQLIAKAA